MIRDQYLSSNFKKKYGAHVPFGDNAKGKIIGIRNIDNFPSLSIEKVLLVENLKHNLLSISQLCDKVCYIKFDSSKCLIKDTTSKEVIFIGSRNIDVYIINIEYENNEKYLLSLKEYTWL